MALVGPAWQVIWLLLLQDRCKKLTHKAIFIILVAFFTDDPVQNNLPKIWKRGFCYYII